jgi:signal peptidase I
MFRIIKIRGESMSPGFHDGDYAAVSRIPVLLGLIRIDSVLVFNTEKYGILIKKVCGIDKKKSKYFFKGSNHLSLSSEEIGYIDEKDILGSVIFHFKK